MRSPRIFHGSFSTFVLGMFCVALLLRREWKDTFAGCGIAAITALPLILYIFKHPFPISESLDFQTWYQLIRLRVAGHTMPFSWHFGTYAKFLPYLFIFFLGYQHGIMEFKDIARRKTYQQIILLSLGIFLLCLIGTIFAEWVPVVPIIKLTLFRSTYFFIIFAVVLYAPVATKFLEMKNVQSLAHISLLAAIISASFPMIYISLLGVYMLYYRRKNKFTAALALVSFVVVISYAWHHYGIEVVWQRGKIPLFSATLGILIVFCTLLRWKWHEIVIKPAAVIAGIAAIALISPVYDAYSNERYFYAVKDLQLWLRDNTPQKSLVIYPPDSGRWSGLSERGGIFSSVDLNRIYTPYLAPEVLSRASDYVDSIFAYRDNKSLLKAFREAYMEWNEEKYQAIAVKYQSEYTVVDKEKALHFPLLYENTFFRVYKIPSNYRSLR